MADALRGLHAKQGGVKFLGSYPAGGDHGEAVRAGRLCVARGRSLDRVAPLEDRLSLFDAEAVGAALIDVLPAASPVTAIEPIPHGWGNESCDVDSSIGPLIVKIGLPWSDAAKWRASAGGVTLAREHGVRAPELLVFDEAQSALDGRIFRAFRYIEGRTAQSTRRMVLRRARRDGATLHSISGAPLHVAGRETTGSPVERLPRPPMAAILGRAVEAGIDPVLVTRAHDVRDVACGRSRRCRAALSVSPRSVSRQRARRP